MKTKTTLMTVSLMLAMLVLLPAPAQADPITEAATTVKQTQFAVFETAEETTKSIEESAFTLTFTLKREVDCKMALVPGCDHPNGSPGECNEDPNNFECVCARYPNSPTCNGDRTFCDNGQQGWDTDHDGRCDGEDIDDDGDYVPDSCDPSPRAPNPVDNAYSLLVWTLAGSPPSC